MVVILFGFKPVFLLNLDQLKFKAEHAVPILMLSFFSKPTLIGVQFLFLSF